MAMSTADGEPTGGGAAGGGVRLAAVGAGVSWFWTLFLNDSILLSIAEQDTMREAEKPKTKFTKIIIHINIIWSQKDLARSEKR
jgi:hypothetical protein